MRFILGAIWDLDIICGTVQVNSLKEHARALLALFFIRMNNPFSDHHQFSPNDIHRLSRDKVMRINKMITCEK